MCFHIKSLRTIYSGQEKALSKFPLMVRVPCLTFKPRSLLLVLGQFFPTKLYSMAKKTSGFYFQMTLARRDL